MSSQSVKPGHEDVLRDNEEICSDEDNDATHDSGGPHVSKVACDRCRRRKIKCDRHKPCNQCLRVSSRCSFPEPQERARRQRVLISSLYERRIEHITQKIDDLVHLMKRLDTPPDGRLPQLSGKNIELYEVEKQFRPTQSSVTYHEGIDTSLFVNALQVAKLLETALDHQITGDHSQATAEIRLSRQTLQTVLDSQGRRGTGPDEGPPFARTLPPGKTFRDLSIPPIEKAMACLRMVQDRNVITVPWLGETKSFGDFTLILIKVCSPGPVTDVELIISLSGLYWLFVECARWASHEAKNDIESQARVCQSSLEVILSTLNFWLPTTADAALAMNLAALFCFHKGKVYACWTFVNKAVMLAKALGLHMASSASALASEERNRRFCLFWSIYCLERSMALRLARPSAICDQHITIPKPEAYPPVQGLISSRQSLTDGVEMSRIFGRVYDDLFSPSALELPEAHRIIRGQDIAAQWRALIASREEHMVCRARWHEDPRGTIRDTMPVDFAQHATRATDYLVLTVIYRVTLNHSSKLPSAECTDAARISLREHASCIALLTNYHNDSALFELWANGGLILFPFLPFNIMFFSVIETGNLNDLESLKALVDALESLSHKPAYTSCAKQLQIFRALYTVAVVYNEARGQWQPESTPTRVPSRTGRNGSFNEVLDLSTLSPVSDSQPWIDFGGMALDPLGTQMGYWIQDTGQFLDSFGET
ncbi:hypothetical protein BU24DRAFT_386428 [Aaosphaeria arxii CBS 175.79]|uniref:Zn(2)-C6 fungal-type domain-containing protein n=1 Tax=Aaosphaeria arxii CBS 175.79 TaxID=1450172 RepID=A0A6A5Y1X0_9PLEO|nr:uncharacterized protein BU24DRAFT_386428 [Aaosphaeria arxii CBS 175.79]KAF2019492.1 hypothetical protein BU24DRAFT_386428 [Aaosphaeria arxii CBS 175.79]